MKVLFLQNVWQPFLGVCYISAKIKSAGHECSLIIHSKIDYKLFQEVQKEKPQFVAFSVMTSTLKWALGAAKLVKANMPKVKIILGGIHPTICPEVIEDENIDFICRGEGEIAFAELLNAMRDNTNYSSIPNLWIKSEDGAVIIKNQISKLESNLDNYPMADRSIYYDKYPFLAALDSKAIMTGRGCPFPCTFCLNHFLIKLHIGKGKIIRRRSPENIIEEIKALKVKYPLEHIYFNDDTFTLDYNYLKEFLTKYKKEFSIPYTCGSRADLVTKEMVELLKDTGCYCIEMGVECGDEKFRTTILKKKITNDEIINAANLIKNAGIKLKTSNMTGMPGETVDIAFQTIDLNRRIGADSVNCSLFQPYPKLEMTEYAIQNGYLDKNIDYSSLEGMSYRKNPIQGKDAKKLRNLQKFFLLCIKYEWLEPFVKRLLNFPPSIVFDEIFKVSYVFNYASYHKLSIIKVFKLAFLGRKNY